MSGGGIGAGLGTAAGLALAPETGGLSLLLPAAGGALGGGLGSALGGGSNPWGSALGGGVTGLLGGVVNGLMSPAGATSGDSGGFLSSLFGSSDSASPSAASVYDAASPATQVASDVGAEGAAAPSSGGSSLDKLMNSFASSQPQSSSVPLGSGAGNAAGSAATGLLSKSNLPYLGIGLAGLGALMPSGSNPINTGNATSAQNAFNASLPSYKYNNVQTPYTGNWYTYGQRPETPMVTNTITPAARGGLMRGYASGGTVDPMPMRKPQVQDLKNMSITDIINALPKGVAPQPQNDDQQRLKDMQQDANFFDYSRGGLTRKLAMGGLPGMAPAMQQPQAPQQVAQFQMGKKIGQALRQHIKGQGMTPDGIVMGGGKGQDDAIPARLSQDEYVLPADIPSYLGDGSSKAGGKVLDKFVHDVRKHKTSHKGHFPPKAHSPLSYIHGGRK